MTMMGTDIGQLARQIAAQSIETKGNTKNVTSPLDGVFLLNSTSPTELDPTLYEPVICLIAQGRKEVWLGDQPVQVGAGESLLVSHEVPVSSRITAASPGEPYLAMIVTLDISILRSLYDEVSDLAPVEDGPKSMVVHPAEPALLDCLSRYLDLAESKMEAKVMTPLLRRELHFRLLMAPHGAMLRELLKHDSHPSAVSRAITKIRREFRSTLKIPDLAREIGMSQSSFRKHFKEVTSTTPLQYQKELRLLEARKLLTSGHSVSDVAFDVGYESPNQFSREYSRKFGAPPRADRPG